jgi:hypothetical protein
MSRVPGRRLTAVIATTACASSALVGLMVMSAPPAGASLTGKCTAIGVLLTGKPPRVYGTYNPRVVDKATVPRKGDVRWRGGTGITGPRVASGEVRIKGAWPLGQIVIGEWGKDGKKVSKPFNVGTYHYDLPSLVAGVKVPVTGEHHEPGINCAGAVVITVKGRSPLAWAALALTVVCVMNMAFVMRAKRRVRA